MANIAIDLTIRCYLTKDVTPSEAQKIVEDLDYNVDHRSIERTTLYDREFISL